MNPVARTAAQAGAQAVPGMNHKLRACLLALGTVGALAACSSPSPTSGQGTAERHSPSVVTVTATPSPSVVTETVTATPTVGAPGAGSAPSFPAGFLGQWTGHGRSMSILPDGTLHIVFRTYNWCDTNPTPGCDKMQGNVIIPGGKVLGHLVAVQNENTVTVDITSTTDSAAIPRGQTRLGRDLQHHALALFAGQFSGVPFCSPQSPSDYCGA